jgi:hypothetical protein
MFDVDRANQMARAISESSAEDAELLDELFNRAWIKPPGLPGSVMRTRFNQLREELRRRLDELAEEEAAQ